jgi:NAD+ kinase
MFTVLGDGLVLATPTGSSAYALSAGGPLLSPAHKGLCVQPLNPHSLHTRSIVTGALDHVEVQLHSRGNKGLMLWLDGQALKVPGQDAQAQGAQAQGAQAVMVTAAPTSECLTLLRYDAPDFYKQASRAFFGGAA